MFKLTRIVIGGALMVSAVVAGPADDLFQKGVAEMQQDQYAAAIGTFSELVQKYQASSVTESARVYLGLCYLYTADYPKAIETLKESAADRQPEPIRDPGMYYLGSAQFYQAQGLPQDDPKRKTSLAEAIKTLGTHIEKFPKSNLHEDALSNRALAYRITDQLQLAEKDLLELIGSYGRGLNGPEYYGLLANVYAAQAGKALEKKKNDEADPLIAKALETYGKVDGRINLLMANRAALESGDLLFSVAVSAGRPDDLPKSIERYRQVRSKKELIPLLEASIESLRNQRREAIQAKNSKLEETLALQLARVQGRLEDVKKSPDPAIEALVHMGRSYVQMRRFDEARVVLRRMQPFASTEQRKELDTQMLLSYALQGQADKADAAFNQYRTNHPDDSQIETVPYAIGEAMLREGRLDEAILQFDKSMELFPSGRALAISLLGKARALTAQGKSQEASQLLDDFITKNKDNELGAQAQLTLAQNMLAERRFADAAKNFAQVRDNPKSGESAKLAAFLSAYAFHMAGDQAKAIAEFDAFLKANPKSEQAPQAMLYLALARQKKGEVDVGIETLRELKRQYPDSPLVPAAQFQIGSFYAGANKPSEMIAAYDELFAKYPDAKEVLSARDALAKYFLRLKDYAKADEQYEAMAKAPSPETAAYYRASQGSMWFNAAKDFGAYVVLAAAQKKEADARIGKAQNAYLTVLKEFPASRSAAIALQGLLDLVLLKNTNEVLTDADAEKELDRLAADVTDPHLQVRTRLLQASFYFEKGDYEKARAKYEAILAANPDLVPSAKDAARYGEILDNLGRYDDLLQLFTHLETKAPGTDQQAQAEIAFGLGAAYLGKGDAEKAKQQFENLRQKYPWYPKLQDVVFKLGLIDAKQGRPKEALARFEDVIRSPANQASGKLRGKAMLAAGNVLTQQGNLLPDPKDKTKPNAVGYYRKAESFYGPSDASLGAQALFLAGMTYLKAGSAKDARAMFEQLIGNPEYAKVSEWREKANAELSKIPRAPSS
jgi:tetratricopeptide (TPR) repeat protein